MTTLSEALGIGDREVVAFVGAGGKTVAMFHLGRELRAAGAGPVLTTTTKILVPADTPDQDVVVETDPTAMVAAVERALGRGSIPVAAVATTADGKLAGVAPERVADLAGAAGVTHVLVEADGAARRPFKAPNDDEPVVPRTTTLVVAVVGIDALGRTVMQAAHRPERVMALTGLGPADVLDARSIARVMLAEGGVMKGAPAGARTVVVVNKADDAARLREARSLARELMAQGARRVIVAALGRGAGVIDVSRRS